MTDYATIATINETVALVARIDANASADMSDVLPDGPQRLVELVTALSDRIARRMSDAGIRLSTVTDSATVATLAALGMSPYGIQHVAGTVADMVRSNYRYGGWGTLSLTESAELARETATVRDMLSDD